MSAQRQAPAFALFVVLVAILFILSAGALLAIHLNGHHMLVRDQYRNLHVDALVDSGISHGMSKIYDNVLYSGTETLEIDGGTVVVAVSFATVERSWVDVWARYQGESRSMRVQVFAEQQGDHPRLVEWGEAAPGPSPFDDDSDGFIDIVDDHDLAD